jgi:hypothetical protein
MFPGLGPISALSALFGLHSIACAAIHLSIASCYHNDSSIHARGTSDHVLDVIGVAGTVDVGIMPIVGGIFDVCGGDGDTAFALLRGLVDCAVLEEAGQALFCLTFGDGSSQCGLQDNLLGWQDERRMEDMYFAVINVTDGACMQVSVLSH